MGVFLLSPLFMYVCFPCVWSDLGIYLCEERKDGTDDGELDAMGLG